jgi:hypothetical protein
MPPIEVYIEKLELSGHSEKTIKKVKTILKKRYDEKEETERFIHTVFGDDKKTKVQNRADQV